MYANNNEKDIHFQNRLISKNIKDIYPLENIKLTHIKIAFYCGKHNTINYSSPNNVGSCKNPCPECYKEAIKNTETISEIQMIKNLGDKNPDVFYVGNYKNMTYKGTKFICGKNNNHIWETTPDAVINGKHKCPYCDGHKVSLDTSIYMTRPDLVKYFEKQEDAKKYSLGSNYRLDFIYPDCGNKQNMIIANLVKFGFSCKKCSPKITYPNRFLRSLLEYLCKNNKIDEYELEKLALIGKKRCRYDGFFIKNSQKFFVEMDGGFHYLDNRLAKEKLIVQQLRDKEKDEYAQNKNIKLIRIPCINSDFDEIKKEILKSNLNEIIDLKNIDWIEIEQNTQTNLVKKVCEDFKQNFPEKTLNQLAKDNHVCRPTFTKYLKIGTRVGWCNYNPEDIPHSTYKRKDYNK